MIQIKQCTNKSFWYYNLVGSYFDVVREGRGYYIVNRNLKRNHSMSGAKVPDIAMVLAKDV